MEQLDHEIIQLPSVGQSGREQLSQQCYALRIDVFHREQGFPLDTEIDEWCLFCSIHGFFAYFRSLTSQTR